MNEPDEVILDLDVNSSVPKADGMFATDQTPTPTKLYKNCEEYGIFEDLKHVNPFDEIFRHAVEEKSGKTHTAEHTPQPVQDEESLHTPQVFPQLEVTSVSAPAAARQHSTPLITDILLKEAETDNNAIIEPTKKYRAIAEKPPKPILNLAQQVVMVGVDENCKVTMGTAIPIQTVKPLILPKVETKLKPSNGPSTVTSPSSASLTPTSQLPIKERLKVILNNNSKTQQALAATETSKKTIDSTRRSRVPAGKYDEHCLERRRAAATRYRNKMRNEHKELQKRNAELQTENVKLRARITELELQLAKKSTLEHGSNGPKTTIATTQIHLPPSSIHFIMNIPKILVPAHGQPILHNPITYSVEKK